MSDSIVRSNIDIVRRQINQKIKPSPFFASNKAANLSVTDKDTFPYPRYYRGVAGVSNPVVFEREAGWRQRHDSCYEAVRVDKIVTPLYCWQTPCSTVLPCKKVTSSAQTTSCVIFSP